MTVNSTARWPQRLEHVATLLRAESAAVLSPSGTGIHTLFAHRLEAISEWRELLGADLIERATASEDPQSAALPAGRWGDAAFAVVARIATPEGPALLCALRHHVPFDRLETDAARAAADLLGMTLADGRDLARADDAFALLEREDGGREKPAGPRVLAVEDHPLMRLGVRSLFEREGITLLGMVATCAEAEARVREEPPDAILLDLSLPDANGIDGIARLRQASRAPIVVFSVERSADLVRAALRAGAVGFVPKDAPAPRVAAALRAAVAGLAALSPADALSLARAVDDAPPAPPVDRSSAETPSAQRPSDGPREPLTTREMDLLRFLAEGHTNKEIARAMVLAEDTVKKAVQLLIAKLGATDRTHAVVLALRQRLIE